jgi:hypothetical protein
MSLSSFKLEMEFCGFATWNNRYKKLVLSIDNKMQQNFWDALVFDDKELELLSNFGETIKFPHETTAVRALSILSTYILKKQVEESYDG